MARDVCHFRRSRLKPAAIQATMMLKYYDSTNLKEELDLLKEAEQIHDNEDFDHEQEDSVSLMESDNAFLGANYEFISDDDGPTEAGSEDFRSTPPSAQQLRRLQPRAPSTPPQQQQQQQYDDLPSQQLSPRAELLAKYKMPIKSRSLSPLNSSALRKRAAEDEINGDRTLRICL
ncbi:MAG: hypothetical protein M1829_001155 [Trizodia sp. TS-e1964]|nr:MAG: hypothetical protein M1829_001155 [Trizodia sp. TS-e1964]